MSPSDNAPPLSVEEKRARLAQLLRQKANEPQRFPTSFAQQRLWFIDQYEPGIPLYTIFRAFRLHGPLDRAALEQSLNEIVRRHAGLRTTFVAAEDHSPVQIVAPALAMALPVHDLRAVPEGEREAEVQRRIAEESQRPFDLTRGPLVRWNLFQTGAESHVLLQSLHHIIADGWTMGILAEELATLYEAYRNGQPSPLPPLPLQYGDIAKWQRQTLHEGGALAPQLDYWLRQLGGPLPVLELPSDRPRPAVQRPVGALHTFTLPQPLTEALRALSQREGATLFMTLLAAFDVLLQRLSGQDDLLIGTPIAGRTRAESERLIGLFINTLVLRTNLSGNPTFRDLLCRVRETSLQAFSYQDVPFEKLVELLSPERKLSHTPLFQVMFALQNAPTQPFALSGTRVEQLFPDHRTTAFDLSLFLTEGEAGLFGQVEYSTDLFDAATITRWMEHFRILLESIVADPAQPIGTLPLLPAAARAVLLTGWGQGPRAALPAETIHALIEAQAARTPDALAILSETEALSYQALEQRANQLAHHLRRLGVGPETIVALYLERSPAWLVALLAVLKAGGAYLPLDPAYPTERVASMLDDAQPALLLTHAPLAAALEWPAARTLLLDAQAERIAQEPTTAPVGSAGGENPAYLIYTSGSTGRPKGVLVRHHALVNHACAIGEAYQLAPTDRVLQFTALSFDVVAEELFPSWATGATVVLRPDWALDSFAHFHRFLEQAAITVVNLPASYWHEWVAALEAEATTPPSALRAVITGSEAVLPDRLARWQALVGDAPRWRNAYGPSEVTITATVYAPEAGSPVPSGSAVPIGQPLANSEVYLLDSQLQPVPVGVPGALYLGGIGLARGYLKRPALTAEAFIPHPFSAEPGARLYRTGDLARYLPDGTLQFLGRVDHQVKLRGFRIELGEIEAALTQHPALREAAVVAHDAPGTGKRLVAYLVPAVQPAPAESVLLPDLRAFLKARLPDYMLPSTFLLLDALPLTPSGKVDRRALPAPDGLASDGAGGYRAPRTPTEEILAGIWADVLACPRVSIGANFFDLGGHSLLATQVVARVRRAFGRDLPLRALFEAPTIAELAPRVEALDPSAAQRPVLAQVELSSAPVLSFAQQRLWFLDQYEPDSATYNLPLALYLDGALDGAALEQSLQALIARHDSLHTTFRAVAGQPALHLEPTLVIPFVQHDLCALPQGEREAEALRLAQEEATRPFDLARGPLARWSLLRLDEERHALLLTLHHIISDGWTMGLLVRELATLYEAIRAGRPAPLPPLPMSYAQVAAWQQAWLQGEYLESQLAYWRQQLAGELPVLTLPTDRPRPAIRSTRGAHQRFTLPADLSDALLRLSQREGATLFMTLMTAFGVLLRRLSGQEEVLIGTPIAGRTHAEWEEIVGLFVNTLVLRADLSGNPTFRDALARTREVALGAYSHQDVPFEKLVEILAPHRDLSQTPLFQVMFALQNAPLGALALPDLTLSLMEVENHVARFDLTLLMEESADGLKGLVEYNVDLFDAATIGRLLAQFEVLLAGIVALPAQRIATLPLLRDSERAMLVSEWGRSATPALPASIAARFEEQVARTPDAVALVSGAERLTYTALNRRANQLAHHLRSLGVGAEARVGLCAERSVASIVALLAILKAGGAYVPLEAGYPAERLAFMLADSAPTLILTSATQAGALPPTAAPRLLLEDEATWQRPEWAGNLSLTTGAESLAYLMYTSGSTGQPKGIAIAQRAVLRLVCDNTFADLGAGETFLHLAPLAFDASTLEIWGPLLNGGRLVLYPSTVPDPAELGRLIAQEGVTTLWLTAGLFHQLVESHLEILRPLRQLLAGGDALSVAAVRKVRRELPAVRLINGYGPTENTTFTCCHTIGELAPLAGSVPIGRAIGHSEVYIFDEFLQPVPIGVVGTLYTGGAGLARGYLNRPALTAATFIPHPFAADEGARLYNTGDLARYLPDGTIEFIGRADGQVKLRGYRIELGEIESVLVRHGAIREAVVVAREEGTLGKMLVGYVVPEADAPTGEGLLTTLRAHLKASLPDYMVPAAFVTLGALPLTPNGKVDRRALPAPDRGERAGGEFVAPRTENEATLAALWADLLAIEQVSVHANFFEIGGHSLLAAQVIARVRAAFGVELPLRVLFEAPTVAELAARVTGGTAAEAGPQAQVRAAGDSLPLSFAQERLWFLDQYEPGSPLYNIPLALRLRGALDEARLEAALAGIVARHEGLRVRFGVEAGQPVQRLVPDLSLPLARHDLRMLPEAERASESLRLAEAEAQAPFDLSSGPLLRASLLREGAESWVLLMTLHHIITDGWTMGLLLRELAALYTGAELPPVPFQYPDYALWQRTEAQAARLAEQLAYWQRQLAGELPVLALPTDRPRPAAQTFNGTTLLFDLPRPLTDALLTLSQREGVTPYMTFLAAFQTLLHRLSGQGEILVGTPIAGRTHAEWEVVVGLFVNTLVLRGDLSGEPSFHTLLGRVREVALGAFAHQETPFEKLVEALVPQRDLSHSPLFQVMFTVQNFEPITLSLPGLSVEPLAVANPTAKFDLGLALRERADGGWEGAIEYNSDLFDAATVARWVANFEVLLGSIVAQPRQRVGDLPLLAPAEREQLLYEWNQTSAPYASDRCLHELVEAQAARTPDATALVAGHERLSYAALNQRADRLAHALRARGVGPERCVGIALERSADLIVSLLAVLKAGGSYVPLDLSYPPERLAFMLADTQAQVILTHSRLAAALPPHEIPTLFLDDEAVWQATLSAQPARVGPDNLAYLIYTSGSTGRPKGVAITHRSAVALVAWASGLYGPEHLAGVLASTSVNFDLSIFEIFVPLSLGGTVILAENALALPDLPAAQEVTLINTVPSAIVELLRLDAIPASVRRVNLAGEPLRPEVVRDIYQRTAAQDVYDLYGPSEDTTYSTVALRTPDGPATIGRPISNTQLYLLDRTMQPVPLGVPGEVYLGGDGLARGYLNRPGLTAEKFVPDPFRAEPGARLYRTGDLARFLPNGRVSFLGRLDHQVKVRGFRIELGEIESALRRHPAVAETVVVARDGGALGSSLVAYVVPEPESTTDEAAMRAHLKTALPDYMVPAAFVVLEAMPLTPNGKVDRRALPAPDRSEVAAGEFVAPRTEAEAILAALWAELLGVGQVSVMANFFALGGHSLLATRMVARLRERLGIELPLRALFEAPTVAELAVRVTGGAVAAAGPRAQARAAGDSLPLSFAQERLWFLDQYEPGSPLYNIPLALRLRGPLDAERLEAALAGIVARHEGLRVRFGVEAGQPVQRLVANLSLPLARHDLRALPEAERAGEAQRLAEAEAQAPFDLSSGPLLRASLLREGEASWVLLLTLHHIVADGWTMGLLLRELAALYTGAELPPVPFQYPDYALWQRSEPQAARLAEQLAYWQTQLAGELPVLALPTDRPRPAAQTFNGSAHAFTLPAPLATALLSLGQGAGATPYMVLLAAFQTLLHRLSGQAEILVGTPIAGRTRAEWEEVVGLFVNTLVLRGDLSGEPSFRTLLGRVRESALGAFAHQETPFEKLVEALVPQRHLSHSPLFQVMFAVQNTPSVPLSLPGVVAEPLAVAASTAKFDLGLALRERSDGSWEAELEYNSDLFDAATIARWVAQFEVLLEGIVAQPERAIGRLPLLTTEERTRLLLTWNATAKALPAPLCVQEWFEEQVARTPTAPALIYQADVLSYAELNRRANQLAHSLRARGVGPEVLVGLHLLRSVEMVVAMLAVLKAGGAYVPLDPSLPGQRLAYLIEASHLSLVLTVAALEPALANVAPIVPRLSLDQAWLQIATARLDNPIPWARGEHPAYVLYTSGSTGQPKGVMIPHRALGNHMAWMLERYPLDATDRVLQKTPFGFDASVWEFFAPLLAGATLVLAEPGGHQDSGYLVRVLSEQAITIVQFVPSMLSLMLEEPAMATCHTLRRVFVGGEVLTVALCQRFFAHCSAALHNLYGPTEATIDALSWDCTPAAEAHTIPIGRPISNLQAYVLDAHLQPVPMGVVGELYLGGVGLARGYLCQPSLTAAKFIPHPFSPEPGARLYRTGDLARYLPDGTLEFWGRRDEQVKLRGYRIELGEIESVLARHPAVRDSVVVARDGGARGNLLVAYVVPEPDAPTGEGLLTALRAHLKAALPDYMVPAAFVALDALPLTPNGKADRRALPAPTDSSAYEAGEEPLTPIEELVATLWGDLLGLSRVGRHATFFELGGHSLLATRVISRLRETLGVELPLRALFEAPTVAELAVRVQAALQGETGVGHVPPLVATERGERPPLSFSQERLWFLSQLDPESAALNIPMPTRLHGPLDIEALEGSLNEILRRHEILRTTFATVEGTPFQRIAPALRLPLPLRDLRALPEGEREAEALRLVREEMEQPFDLASGPLVRWELVRLDEAEHLLLLTVHHIIADGWSMSLLVGEMVALYESFLHGESSPLPEPPVQYADYARWQREWLQGEALEAQIAYWTHQLAGSPPTLELPTDRTRPPVQGSDGGMVSVQLPEPLARALLVWSQREGTTLFMTMLAAFQVLLHRYSGQEDILVGTPIAGRNRAESERLIGLFLNTLVLRTDLSGTPSFREVVRRVREVALGAYAHQDVPFEKLLEVLAPVRDLSHAPLFQVFFNMLNLPSSQVALVGVTAEPMALPEIHAKFDLTLYAGENDGAIRLALVYNRDLFTEGRVREMVAQYSDLLTQVMAEPEQPITALSLVTPTGAATLPDPRQPLSDHWQGSIHARFAERARQQPERLAVRDSEGALTYGEVDILSRRVAASLRAAGIGREEVVAIYGHRSAPLVWALLGTLRAGAAFTVLDPAYPSARLGEVLALAQPRAFLHLEPAGALPEELETSLAALSLRCRLTLPRHDGQGVAEGAPDGTDSEVGPDDLAYLSFTSGSTGVPKGILGRHGPLSHFYPWMAERFGLDETDRYSMLSGLSHDPLHRDIFTPLWLGAAICVPDPAQIGSPGYLARWMAEEGVTVTNLTPAMGQILTEPTATHAAGDGLVPFLRRAFFVGDILTRRDVTRLQRLAPAVTCINLYGSTETQRAVGYFEVPASASLAKETIPLGQGMADVQLLVLTERAQQAGIGEVGEIYVRSPHLARGYLGQPELTAERFLTNPFTGAVGDRLYRTGDLGRYLPDGTVESIGRSDQQVKIRGFRIELGEIEATLGHHPLVREAVVVAREELPGVRTLAAYIVMAERVVMPDTRTLLTTLRTFLKERLPDYMVPADFVFLPALPVTPNGKVDRRALPAPTRTGSEGEFVAPSTPTEEGLAALWGEVLGLERVSVHANFFDLGGHSLLATQVLSRVEATFQIQLPLRTIFEAPTVAKMAACIAQQRDHEAALMAEILEQLGSISDEELSHYFNNEP